MPKIDMLQLQSDLIANYNAYGEGIDTKNWDLVRSCFGDEVIVEYGELSASTGEVDVARQSDGWVAILKSAISGFDLTRHTITNHRVMVDGDIICCKAYLMADHVIFPTKGVPVIAGDDCVTVVGEYTNHYVQIDGDWKINRSQLDVQWSTGNVALFEQAMKRGVSS